MMQKQRQEGFESPPPDEEFRYKIMQQRLQQIINDLPLQQKTVYQFSREHNLKQEEIARQMNIALSTVQNHLTQALKTIRDRLKEHLT